MINVSVKAFLRFWIVTIQLACLFNFFMYIRLNTIDNKIHLNLISIRNNLRFGKEDLILHMNE